MAPVGEVVFNTSMCGYQEILTDPSYAGQVIVMTYPHIGNYGVNHADRESQKIHARALVVRELADFPSNFSSEESLEAAMVRHRVPCMSELDTRALTLAVRSAGSLRCTFLADQESPENGLRRIRAFDYGAIDFTAEASGAESTLLPQSKGGGRPRVAVLDFGVKYSILELLNDFCEIEVFSMASVGGLDLGRFDGFFLSNGPGDPAAVQGAVPLIRRMLATGAPLFGICLGHQLLALALGGRTYKLKFGHHGANHPIKNLMTGRVEITSQNHGYAVDPKSFSDPEIIPTHTNLNDGSLAGLMIKGRPVYSIQYHPEASPGPHDARYLFSRFREDLAGFRAGPRARRA